MKPMLSATIEDITTLKYPLYASPKLDGIRAMVIDNVLYSRNLKPIPNHYINRTLPLGRMNGWDGELIVGKPASKDVFRNTTSGVMSEDGQPEFTFYVFDYIPVGEVKYQDRFMGLKANMKSIVSPHVKLVPQVKIKGSFELHQYEEMMLERGYEGVMLRSPEGLYKYGRSTLREGYLMKLKRFADSEAVVLRVVEQMHNANVATVNALGNTERSSHKANKHGKGTMGALRVVDVNTAVEFDIGTGFDDNFRKMIWEDPTLIAGKTIKYKYFPTGSKEKPRFPVFLGIRKD